MIKKARAQFYLTHPELYSIWKGVKTRILNKKSKSFHNYGGRGISMADSWKSIDFFIADMESSFRKGLTLDRIDVNGDYCKENCRWVTRAEQNRNTRYNLKYNGETASEASRRLGGDRNLVNQRLTIYKWDLRDAFTLPVVIEYRKHA